MRENLDFDFFYRKGGRLLGWIVDNPIGRGAAGLSRFILDEAPAKVLGLVQKIPAHLPVHWQMVLPGLCYCWLCWRSCWRIYSEPALFHLRQRRTVHQMPSAVGATQKRTQRSGSQDMGRDNKPGLTETLDIEAPFFRDPKIFILGSLPGKKS